MVSPARIRQAVHHLKDTKEEFQRRAYRAMGQPVVGVRRPSLASSVSDYYRWTESGPESLPNGGIPVKFGNCKVKRPRDLGFNVHLDKLGVTGSSPVSPTH
jgi:hypothetical protein